MDNQIGMPSKKFFSIFLIALAALIIIIAGFGVYLHFNPTHWPGSDFQTYVPTSLPAGLRLNTSKAVVRIQPSGSSWVREFLPPSGIFLSIPFGSYAIREERNYLGTIRTNHTTPHGQAYQLNQNTAVSPTLLFVKGSTLITIPLGTAITTTQLETMIDSFMPTTLANPSLQYDTYSGGA